MKLTPQNVQNLAMKQLACGSLLHVSFEHYDVILWSIREKDRVDLLVSFILVLAVKVNLDH